MEKLGRLSVEGMKHVVDDAPEQAVKAILTKQDEILTKLNLLLAAIKGAVDGNTLNTALQGVDLTALSEVVLNR